ncbi:MAG: FG-GAP repeat protein [Bacteroidetes bacterium]|nr:FG-GAP repeat protein [Bacteroidota bacterium]
MSIIKHCLFTILSVVIISVNAIAQQQNALKIFTSLPQSETGISFTNNILETDKMFLYMYDDLYAGTGVAVGDINNDGLPDVYFNSTMGSNKLYLNID